MSTATLLCPQAHGADDDARWVATLNEGAQLPSRIVVVDKTAQQLALYEHKSPLQLLERFTCTTGQKSGNKFSSGDLRTPEGVYFVVGKVPMQLDFTKYGSAAYALNYPSPIDKLQGKTGHGIWIHSRGRPIAPMETEGCIAVNLDDMSNLEPKLTPGMAVVVADTVRTDATPDTAEAAMTRLIEKKTREWNAAWAARSTDMFQFYSPEAYTKAQGEAFQAFRGQKERLFKSLSWIHIIYGDIQVLRGPGYWVSWFNQYYRAPNLSTEGVRRLYWQADDAGELRIVGMEWMPQDLGMETAYLETVTSGVTSFVERWRKAWETGNLKAYMAFYAPNAVQKPLVGAAAIEQNKVSTWAKGKPAKVSLTGLRVMVLPNGVSVDMTQAYSNTKGYSDKGIKKIILHPSGNSWVIASEEWSPIKP